MPVPAQMTDHTLETVKGTPFGFSYVVDFVAKFNAAQLAAISGGIAFGGRCVHVNNAGEFEFGVSGREMPMFLIQNSNDPDVENPGGDPATVAGGWVSVAPTGKMSALVGVGDHELATTEFDNTKTYQPNQPLTANSGTTLATAGVLTNVNATPGTNAICGIVSVAHGPLSPLNSHGKPELRFWPWYNPVP